MGRFMLGSTVVLLFPEGDLRFDPAWQPGAPVRLGEAMAELAPRRVAACAPSSSTPTPALRALAEAIGPAVLPQLELSFGDADIAPDALPAALAGAPIAVIDHTALPIEIAARCAGLRDVVFLGTGARSYMDPEALAAIGITVHLIKGYGDTAVAECAIGLLFDAARKFAAMDRAMRAGRWLRSEGMQLGGKTLGLIGYGGIAAEVARMALGIGMRVVAWNRTPKAASPASSSSPSSGCSPRATQSRSICCSTTRRAAFSRRRGSHRCGTAPCSSTPRAARWSTRRRWSRRCAPARSATPASTSSRSSRCRRAMS